jgi:AraC-like DNA-binding protein
VATSRAEFDRVIERRRAVALSQHYRYAEGLSIAQIADRLGRSPAAVKAYFYDPTGAKAKAVKARYAGVCRGCGAYTQPRTGKGDAYAYRKRCHPGAIQRKWTRERVLAAMREWRERYGWLPSSYDWSRTHAGRRGGGALERLNDREWPSASVVGQLFEGWQGAREAAGSAAR